YLHRLQFLVSPPLLPSSNNDRHDPERTCWNSPFVSPEEIRRQRSLGIPMIQEQLTKLPSGLTVASARHNGPTDLVHLTLTYRAGARYNIDQKGLSYLVSRILSTSSQWDGGSNNFAVTTKLTPDFLSVSMTAPRYKSKNALNVFGRLATLKDWELNELPEVVPEGAPLPVEILVADRVRIAAYGNGSLANSTRERKSILLARNSGACTRRHRFSLRGWPIQKDTVGTRTGVCLYRSRRLNWK
ncbi:hypothetical protein PMAYCL1PPCAC_20454, partial [Pristionchus mayeri]